MKNIDYSNNRFVNRKNMDQLIFASRFYEYKVRKSNSIEYEEKKDDILFNSSLNILKKKEKSKFNHREKIHNNYKYRCIQINITCEIHFDLLDDDQDIFFL